MTILSGWHPPPKPWLKAQRDAAAAELTMAEREALATDERLVCYPLGEWVTRRERMALRFTQWRLRRRTWRERLDDTP